MMQAFIDRDIQKLSDYQILLKSHSRKYRLEFKVMFAILNNSVENLSEGTKQKVRNQLLKIGN